MIRFLMIFVFSTMVLADPQKGLISGDQAAKIFLNKSNQNSTSVGNHPFYQGIPSESTISSDNLKGQAQRTSNGDPAAQIIYQSSDARPQIKIDPAKDPLITGSEKIMANPLEAIGGKGTQVSSVQQGGKTEIKLCKEAGDDSLETCTRELTVRVEKIKIRKEWKGQYRYWKERRAEKEGHYLACGALRQEIGNARMTNGNITPAYLACMRELGGRLSAGYVSLPPLPFPVDRIVAVNLVKIEGKKNSKRPSPTKQIFLISGYSDYNDYGCKYDYSPHIIITYEEDSYRVLPDEWSDSCARLETRVDSGLCSYFTKVCTQGPQTRTIGGIPITRGCWQETMTYSCSYPSKDNCGPLRAQGCAQINSICKQKVGNACVVYEQTYQCKPSPRTSFQITGGKTPFCMDGNCRDQSWETNDEMMSSIAQLSLLKEMQGQFANGLLFKGEDKKCSKYILNFKDCCGSSKGWGKDMGLASCSGGEKDLSQKRKKGLCHFVGIYCAKKVLGKCVEKKSSYCCFTNKLLKSFHVQGRPQIGLGWVDPKEPLCRGFTVDEIQRIDFSKLDLREVFEEIMQNFRSGKSNTKDMGKTINNRMDTIQKTIIQNPSKPVKQRDGLRHDVN